MRKIIIDMGQFQPFCGSNMRPWEMIVHRLLEDLAFANAVLLQCQSGRIPFLYDAVKKGLVRYQREPPGVELFNGILAVLRDRGGDCDDLAAWRVAELRVRGSPYYPKGESAKFHMIKYVQTNGKLLYHIQVRRAPTPEFPDGAIEDPSRIAGMGAGDPNANGTVVLPPHMWMQAA